MLIQTKREEGLKKHKKFSKDELGPIFVTLNQEQMNKIRRPINIRGLSK